MTLSIKPLTASIKPLAISIALASATLSHADGTVEGRIIDANSQVNYSQAVVRLEELNREVPTNQGGRFRLPQVTAGEYTLTVTIGSKEVERRSILVADQQTTKTNVLLNESDQEVEEVLVIGQAAQLQRALDRQRYSDGIVSAINADAIGELPDANAAEALQRIPGLSIERDQGEGRFVRVRGLGADFNSVAVNGTQIPAPEAGSRAVALDVIPSSLISSLIVTKTLTPDMDANSLGGSIEIEGISALDRDDPFYSADINMSHDQHTDSSNPSIALGGGISYDVGDDGRFGIAASFNYETRDFGSDNVETGGAWDYDEDEGIRLEELEVRDYTINRERIGASLNLDYEQDVNNSYYLRTLFSQFADDEQRQALVVEFEDAQAAGEIGSGDAKRELKDRKETQTIFSSTFGAEHFINDWTVEYSLALSKAKENEPDTISGAAFEASFDQLGFINTREPRLIGTGDLYDASQFELDEIEREKGYTEDKIKVAALDITRDLMIDNNPAFVKFGAKFKQREKTQDRTTWEYGDFDEQPGFQEADANMGTYVNGEVDYGLNRFGPALSANAVRDYMNSLDRAEFFEEEKSRIEDYSIDQDINAAYLMGRIDIDALRITAGVRQEQTDIHSDGYGLNSEENIVAVSHDQDYSHTLPGLLARYELGENTQIRAAWTNAVVRPTFEQIRPNYEIDGDEIEAGNPELDAMESANFDLGIEHFMGNAGAVSLFVFSKDITNFVYETDLGASGAFSSLAPVDGFKEAKTFQNGDDATVQGVELAISQKMTMLPAPFDGLLLSANVTLVDSDATIVSYDEDERFERNVSLPNQSDVTGNVVIGYEKDALSLRLATNYKSDYLDEVGLEKTADIHQSSQTQVDFNASYQLEEGLKIRFKAANLTDEPYYTYQNKEKYNAQYEDYGPTYSIGLSYTSF